MDSPTSSAASLKQRLATALDDHRLDLLSQDSGMHCVCGSDNRFTQGRKDAPGIDPPWSTFPEHLADVVLNVLRADARALLLPAQGPHSKVDTGLQKIYIDEDN